MNAIADRWRGVAAEDVDDFSPNVAGLLRKRSRNLLANLARPYRRDMAFAAGLILIRSAAYLSLPYLVGLGIDKGVRPGSTGNLNTLYLIVGTLLAANDVTQSYIGAFLSNPANFTGLVAFTPANGQSNDTGPLYSWVVDILPFIDNQELYNACNRNRVYFDLGRPGAVPARPAQPSPGGRGTGLDCRPLPRARRRRLRLRVRPL